MDLHGTSRTQAAHLIGVSVPRSGHNLVVRLLQALCADDLFYCERYGVEACCQAVPCARRATRQVSFQKSHDLDLDLPRDVVDAFYLIQHRAPVPAILSAREMYADTFGDTLASDRGAYAVWLGQRAEYLVSFYERWIAEPPPSAIVVDYDELVSCPVEALRRIVDAAGIAASDEAIQAAVARTVPAGGQFGERPFVPRSIERSRYLDRALLASFESIVVDAVPAYASRRVFEPFEYRRTLVWHVFTALRARRAGDFDEAMRRFDEALEQWPGNGLLLYEQASLLQALKRFDRAEQALQEAARCLPAHPPILDALVTVALAAGNAPAALEAMLALANQIEPTPANRLRLAKMLAHNSDRAGAAEILDEVTSTPPADAQVWSDIGEVRLIRGELSLARLALESAISLAPLQAGLYHRHADVLLKLGKPRRAVDSLRQALALDPRQPASWTLLVEALVRDGDRAGALQAADEARAQLPDDAELQTTVAAALRQDELAIRPPAHMRRSSAGEALLRRARATAARLPGARRADRLGRRALARLAARFQSPDHAGIQLAQLRAALGVAERRVAETEQRMHQELEKAWSQAHTLASVLEGQTRAAEAAGAHARRLDAALDARNREVQSLRLRLWRLEEALRVIRPIEDRSETGLARLMRRG